jgi:hypothetical protein
MNEEQDKNSPQSTDDNQPQEPQLITPSRDEIIVPAETTTETETETEPQPSTTNYQPPTTTDMEVHHHAHDPAAPHHKKNWKSYFWEFLMLFLAVFCGFLAEYQLEHYIEKQRAKEFAVSLYRDLVGDTTAINNINHLTENCISDIDSLTALLDQQGDLKANTINVYKYSVNAFGLPQYQPNESTLQQLLNSGSLRYFKNATLVDSIKYYNNQIQRNAEFSKSAYEFNLEFRKIQLQVVKIGLLNKARYSPDISNQTQNNHHSLYDHSNFLNQPLITYDAQKIEELSNWCAFKQFYLINTLRRNMVQKSTAVSLIKLLKETYHIQ